MRAGARCASASRKRLVHFLRPLPRSKPSLFHICGARWRTHDHTGATARSCQEKRPGRSCPFRCACRHMERKVRAPHVSNRHSFSGSKDVFYGSRAIDPPHCLLLSVLAAELLGVARRACCVGRSVQGALRRRRCCAAGMRLRRANSRIAQTTAPFPAFLHTHRTYAITSDPAHENLQALPRGSNRGPALIRTCAKRNLNICTRWRYKLNLLRRRVILNVLFQAIA
jgi:hypothetical protein